jgi:hypothetical protein
MIIICSCQLQMHSAVRLFTYLARNKVNFISASLGTSLRQISEDTEIPGVGYFLFVRNIFGACQYIDPRGRSGAFGVDVGHKRQKSTFLCDFNTRNQADEKHFPETN